MKTLALIGAVTPMVCLLVMVTLSLVYGWRPPTLGDIAFFLVLSMMAVRIKR